MKIENPNPIQWRFSERASQLLREAGDLKVAILMERRSLPYAAAKARLKLHKGILGPALEL